MQSYTVLIKTTSSARTLKQLFNWTQYKLLSTNDIDAGAGTQLGYITAELISMAGSTVFTEAGVWVEGFTATDRNSIQYRDSDGVSHTPPLSVSIVITCSSSLNGGRAAVYQLSTAYDPETYVPGDIVRTLLDAEIASGTAQASLTYATDLNVVVRTRKAGYIPFEVGTTLTSSGLAVTSQNPVDTVYEA
jgi:hypothetical protein